MSNSPEHDFPVDESAVEGESRADAANLPPVEPPSAGFIIQLFVVPGLIVLAVVAVWALFGKLASGEQDWQSLVAELSHSNEHRRWRGAHGLAQLLQAERGDDSEAARLSRNRTIIEKLTTLLEQELAKKAPSEDDLKFQAFLALTMGSLDSPENVLPVLRQAMQPQHDREVRKNAVAAVAVIADRAQKRGETLDSEPLVADLIDVSADPDPLMKQVGAFTLGLFPDEAARTRLIVLLDDADGNTSLNAAIALSRSRSTAGIDVFTSVLDAAAEPFDPAGITISDEVKRQEAINSERYQRDLRLQNTLQAVENLAGEFTPEQRAELTSLLETVADSGHWPGQFRYRANAVINELERAD